MEDQICSPEKYSMKNSYNKNIFYLNEKNIYDINISYWIKIYFGWMKIYLGIMKKGDIMKIYFIEYKFVLIEWKYILISWERRWYNKNTFIKYKIILIEWKFIFISYECLFLEHFSNDNLLQFYLFFLSKRKQRIVRNGQNLFWVNVHTVYLQFISLI